MAASDINRTRILYTAATLDSAVEKPKDQRHTGEHLGHAISKSECEAHPR
jgi:hypothetical protein